MRENSDLEVQKVVQIVELSGIFTHQTQSHAEGPRTVMLPSVNKLLERTRGVSVFKKNL